MKTTNKSFVEQLAEKHQEMGVVRFSPFWGPQGQSLSDEEKAKVLLSVYWEMERGHCAKQDCFSETGTPIHKRAKHKYREMKAWFNRTKDGAMGIKNPYKD